MGAKDSQHRVSASRASDALTEPLSHRIRRRIQAAGALAGLPPLVLSGMGGSFDKLHVSRKWKKGCPELLHSMRAVTLHWTLEKKQVRTCFHMS